MSPFSPLHAKVKCILVFAFSLHFCSLHFTFEFIWHFNERIMSAWQPWQPWQSQSRRLTTLITLGTCDCSMSGALPGSVSSSPVLPPPHSFTHSLQLSNWVTHFGSCRCTWIFWAAVVLVHVRHKNLNYLSAHTHTHTHTQTRAQEERVTDRLMRLKCWSA